MELPQFDMQGLLGKKLGKPSAALPAPERRVGDRAAQGRQLAPTFYSHSLGCDCLEACSKTHMHSHAHIANTSGESLTYSPNHFIDLWAKDVKAY